MRVEDTPPRWRSMVATALEHRSRFKQLVELAEPGPIRDRVASIGHKVDDGVENVWSLVRQGAIAEEALSLTDPRATAERLKAARRQLAEAGDDGGAADELQDRVEALSRSHAAAQRLWNSVEDLDSRLGVVNARLAAVVAHTAELAAGGFGDDALDDAARQLDDVLTELEATRQALAEVEQL